MFPKGFCKKGHELTDEIAYVTPSTGKRCCRICQAARVKERRTSDPTFRQRNTENMRKWRAENREQANKLYRDTRWRKKEQITQLKLAKGGCVKCGESDPVCLDFHHRDPSTKVFNVAVGISKYTVERIAAEVAKCDILCANCHRKHHATERLDSSIT